MRSVYSFLVTAQRSLFVHTLRSFLSILGVICGVAAVMAMISTGEGAKQKILDQIGDLGIKNIYIKRLTLSEEQQRQAGEKRSHGVSIGDFRRLQNGGRNISRIAAMREMVAAPVGTRHTIIPRVIRSTSEYARILGLAVAAGRFISFQDCEHDALVCVLGASLAQKLGDEGRLGEFIRLQDSLYKIVGILPSYKTFGKKVTRMAREDFNTTLLLPLATRNNGGKFVGPAPVSEIVVEVDAKQHVVAVASMIDRLLYLAHNTVQDYQLVVPLQLLNQSLKTQNVLDLVLAITGGISLLIGGIGIMNIMLVSVSERKREIGIRRSVGATKKDIVLQFLTESMVLTTIGGSIGVLVGFVGVFGLELLSGWPMKITLPSLGVPFGLAVFTGVAFGLYPALKAAELDPIQALRAL